MDSQLYPGGGAAYRSLDSSAKEKALSAARDAWSSSLFDELANYAYIGFTYRF